MVQHVVLLLLCYSLLLTGAVPPVPPLLPRGPLPAVVTSAAPLSLPKLVAGLTAAAGLPVACSPVCGSTGQVCAVKTQSRPWPDTPPAAVRVTVVSTLFRTDPRLAAAWLADVHGQTVVNATELLVCLVGSAYSPELVRLLGATMGGTVAGGKGGGPTQPLQKLASLRVVFFETDPGLYPSWSCAMRRVASQSAYVTNWNADDRRAPFALSQQARLLDSKPHVDLVAGPVWQFTTPPEEATWERVRKHPASRLLRLVGTGNGKPKLPRALALSDFGKVAGGKFQVANPPHNAPLLRPRLLAVIGEFDNQLDPLADWELWVRGIVAGRTYWFLSSPLQAWHRSGSQYSSKKAGGARDGAAAAVLARHCPAWRHALRNPRVCASAVVPREKSTRETADDHGGNATALVGGTRNG